MLGAITGDIIGSAYVNKKVDKNFPLFCEESHFTDATVLTIAVLKAFFDCHHYYYKLEQLTRECMQELGTTYTKVDYGEHFSKWLREYEPMPYNSYGCGCVARISAVALFASKINDVKDFTYHVCHPTHNNPEAVMYAEAVAMIMYLAVNGKSKEEIRKYLDENYKFNLDFNLEELRENYTYSRKCRDVVPQAIYLFLISDGYEEAIRNAVYIGGNTEDVCAITGTMAEAMYGIPDEIREKSLDMLPNRLRVLYEQF